MTAAKKPSLRAAFTSWRLGAISLLSLSSGLPLGLVMTGVPAWLAAAHVDIKTIGLVTLVQIPYGFKFIWAPLMDRLRPPFMGYRRGWILICQLTLAAVTAVLGALASQLPVCDPKAAGAAACDAMAAPSPTIVGLIAGLSLLIAFASASQDIVYDAYAVEVLTRDEHGLAVGARSSMYRVGMWISGNIAISLAPYWGWGWTLAAQATVYLMLLPVTVFAPEPKLDHQPPTSLKDAVWQPFVGFLSRPRALEIAAFVLLYRLADSVAGSLVSPFLIQKGFSAWDVGVLRGGFGFAGTIVGAFFGGVLAGRIGVGRALWVCGILQIVAIPAYALIAHLPVDWGQVPIPFVTEPLRGPGGLITLEPVHFSPLLQFVIFLETGTLGLSWGALGVMLLRLTDKRFSATQYALFSSLVGMARTFVGPPAGVMADALGWRDFFFASMLAGIPGLIMLGLIVPWGRESKEFTGESVDPLPPGPPWSKRLLLASGLTAAVAMGVTSMLLSGLMAAIKQWRGDVGKADRAFHFLEGLERVARPESWKSSIDLASALVFGVVAGVAVAAYMAARGRPVRAAG